MKKTQIYVLNLALLPNDKHMAVTAFMANALREYAIADTVVGRFVTAYLAAYERENQAFKRIDRRGLTKKVNDADTERINCLRIIRDSLRLFMIMKDEQKKAAAEEIFETIELYGGGEIYSQPVDARTGNITNIIEDLEGELGGAVHTLEMEPAVENLKEANEKFLKAQSDRDKADAEYGKNTMADARVETDRIWRAVVEEVNNTIAYGTDDDREALVPFARYMNVEIDKYRIQTGQGVGGNSGTSIGNEDEDENGVLYKFATFEFKNGESVKLRFEVGAPLEAPANTEGYKWSPEVPELMPATNKIFREVPIETREATATFHFFDHSEEIIKQIVGTALTAPENTFGYYWDPTVPATMPAEDTAYYELPTEDNENTGGENTGGDNTGGDNTGGDNTGGDNNTGGNTGGGSTQKYTVTYWHNGAVYTTQEYEAGQRIQLPAAPEGYRWTNIPPQMPAENITITSQEIGPDDF